MLLCFFLNLKSNCKSPDMSKRTTTLLFCRFRRNQTTIFQTRISMHWYSFPWWFGCDTWDVKWYDQGVVSEIQTVEHEWMDSHLCRRDIDCGSYGVWYCCHGNRWCGWGTETWSVTMAESSFSSTFQRWLCLAFQLSESLCLHMKKVIFHDNHNKTQCSSSLSPKEKCLRFIPELDVRR